ncbi:MULTISPECIES: cytochrome c [unclassified Pseudonocardia]|uniref:cytochrome bc1 complex diheme cytochrome c subunit n=1 Tax=unclassified Pseudonocardia TaxID=2619320 RepID=UPI0001FFEC55|nr:MULTISPECIES: cytochrome c [unclassified Pseudonocardia]OLM19503.1 ubiquinol cytochrome C oxidoreductase, cytochrome C1 subunit [Pseudonocardia sp. Ae707_Ps1]
MTENPEGADHAAQNPPPGNRPDEKAGARRRPHGKLRRRIAGALAIGLGLLSVGFLYAAFAPQPQLAEAQPDAALIAKGEQLYNNTCITCHGANLQGEQDRGPSLIGVGDAAVYFQVSSGRMPMARQEAQAMRKHPLPIFDPESAEGRANLEALGAYIQANGGGPVTPVERGEALRGEDPGRGGTLYRLNCASCHNFTGVGGALSSGKFAPALAPASEEQIYTAMQTGPQNMPRFSDQQLTSEEKQDIIAYIKSVNNTNDPGGNALLGLGPTAEGIFIFTVVMSGLVGFAIWLGAKS